MPSGGARPNSGPKKGAKYKGTISKEQAREALRQVVLAHMEEMVAAQVAHAKGLKYLMLREKKTGKFVRMSEAAAKAALEDTESPDEIEVWEKDPSTQAFTDLMNRALDKPKEQEQTLRVIGGSERVQRLIGARQRLQGKTK